jgi:subtilisin family serine protease
VLPGGKFDPTPFGELTKALDEQMRLRQRYMLTFMVEGKTVDHWGMQVPTEVDTSDSHISAEGSGPLAGKTIALNPGHGRYYTGSTWAWQRGWLWGIIEDLVNAEIQIYVAQYLEDLGATIIYLREPDKEAGIGESGLLRWKESARHYLQLREAPERVWNTTACGSDNLCKDIMARPYGANYYGADLLISVHNNGGGGTGTETWYDTSGDYHSVASAYSLADNIHTNVINEIQAEYDIGWTDRGVKSSDGGYGENHYAQMPAALIEVAFMDTESPDNEALQSEAFKQLVAKAIVQGVCDYYGASCTLAIDPDDPYFSYEWGLDNTGQTGGKDDADIDAPEAWEITTGVTETMIAVIDTGVDYNHEDLDDGRVRTDIDQDYVNDDDDAMDDHSHGTHVAGTIAAETNNGVGVAGVMWQAQILPLKVLGSRGSGSADDVAAAIRYAADQEADVINMSLGSRSCSQTIADAVNYAYDKGVVIVAAAGNSGSSIGYPAKHAPVIAVGATDHNDHKAYFSNYGDELDVVAPGVSIFSTVPNNGYDAFSGTSMASPHVAGVVGLLLSQRSDLSNGQVREILRQSADDLGQGGFDTYYGYGRVNAHQALQAETPEEPPAPEDAKCTPTGPCAAGVAVEGTDDGTSILSDLRAVRDEVFTEDPGQRWVDIYYEHQGEVAWLLATHKDLRADALTGFRAFAPVFRAGLDEGPSVTLTSDLIEAAREALMGVAEHGSDEIHDDIVREWEKVDPYRFVGQDVLEVWKQLKQEERTMKVYLPLVMK